MKLKLAVLEPIRVWSPEDKRSVETQPSLTSAQLMAA